MNQKGRKDREEIENLASSGLSAVKLPLSPALLARDEAWSQRLAMWGQAGWRRWLAWLLARTGDSVAWLLVIAVTWTRWRELSVALLWTVALTAVLVYLAKYYFKRERPSDPHRGLGADKFSFPSGHAARVTAVAITLSFLFPLWTVAFLLWGTAVALSRVALARHFFSDIIGGAVVGLVVSLLLRPFL